MFINFLLCILYIYVGLNFMKKEIFTSEKRVTNICENPEQTSEGLG